ncbi:cytochrome c biogenesis protein CcdA [Paenibacillus sp. ACRRX]|uniref:cytochrome c biogenesis CcdA family protein n=1 Tax=unclassified Paenibacillus TaxID=185978 RepID=UPI001EF507F8|nr:MULTISPECIES: cytochrome c biogenesis protein CcdA [unclassified Paenibacillus]MCG7406280.1 cytochrome c biogenesis protein CcdA [Paenibacillus sp. ACRRX]MDK8179313.1 cytochrome c biogenesis protein CcdA [Paenibacillus sp. UMB4589-SE434]
MTVTIWVAFWAGMVSFISPCCLPLYPSYISVITGMSVNQLKNERSKREVRWKTMTHTLFFILGFSAVFYTLGLSAGVFGSLLVQYRDLVRQIAGIIIIIMGLFLIGVFKPHMLMRERKWEIAGKRGSYFGSFLFGIGFSAGWSPCVGPILGAILSLATQEPDSWFWLSTAYALGFAIPFFVLAFFIGSTRWLTKYSAPLMKVGGILMIIMGVLLFTDQLTDINIWLLKLSPQWLIDLT